MEDNIPNEELDETAENIESVDIDSDLIEKALEAEASTDEDDEVSE